MIDTKVPCPKCGEMFNFKNLYQEIRQEILEKVDEIIKNLQKA